MGLRQLGLSSTRASKSKGPSIMLFSNLIFLTLLALKKTAFEGHGK